MEQVVQQEQLTKQEHIKYPHWREVNAAWIKSLPQERRLQALKHYIRHSGKMVKRVTLERKRKEYQDIREDLLPQISSRQCELCQSQAKHRHHIIPLNTGGENVACNMIALCYAHHEEVHGFSFQEYAKFLEKQEAAKKKPRRKKRQRKTSKKKLEVRKAKNQFYKEEKKRAISRYSQITGVAI